MAKRDITIAEVKAMLEELAEKISEGGANLYQDIMERIDELTVASSKRAEILLEEIGPKLELLKDKVSKEGAEIIDMIEGRVNQLSTDVKEELAELKEVGLVNWIKANPMIAAGICGVIILLISIIAIL